MRKIVLPQQKYLPMTRQRIFPRPHQKNLTCHTRQPKHKGNTPTLMYTCKNVHKTLEVAVLVSLCITENVASAVSNQIIITVRRPAWKTRPHNQRLPFPSHTKRSRDSWIARRLFFFIYHYYYYSLKPMAEDSAIKLLQKCFTREHRHVKLHLHKRHVAVQGRSSVHISDAHAYNLCISQLLFFLFSFHVPHQMGYLDCH